MSLRSLNPSADLIGRNQALQVNIGAARSMQKVLASNLGPLGTVKMLVSGGGEIALTKDGKVLLNQMQIQHPTASLIARTATAQDDITGDGTTSNVLFTGELLAQAERYISDGLHPRVLVEGMELARDETVAFLETLAKPLKEMATSQRDILVQAARTSLRTKLQMKLADHLADLVVDAVLCIAKADAPLDLHMVEIMAMQQRSELDTMLVKGLVLDHGARHPNMSRYTENAYILTCNVSLEFEKTEVNSGFFYSSAEEREKMVAAERAFTDDKVHKIIALKNLVCGDDRSKGFVVINQKGIDPVSLDLLQKANIVAIRRAKRRNMERLALACGGYAVNSVDDLDRSCLGFAAKVYEHALGDDRFTFVETTTTTPTTAGSGSGSSCTLLVRGPNKHTITQIKDAIRDGLRAVKNVLDDGGVVPGAGAFELAAHLHLHTFKTGVAGRLSLGVQAFADALLVIPKTLVANAGLDVQQTLLELLCDARRSGGEPIGVDLATGKAMLPGDAGIWDNVCVKRQFLQLGSIIATKLLLVDEIMRAGRASSKDAPPPGAAPGM